MFLGALGCKCYASLKTFKKILSNVNDISEMTKIDETEYDILLKFRPFDQFYE